jgi:hypothetical protein
VYRNYSFPLYTPDRYAATSWIWRSDVESEPP